MAWQPGRVRGCRVLRPRRMIRLCSKLDSDRHFVLALAAAELPDGTVPQAPGSSSYGPLPTNRTARDPANPRVETAYGV